MFFSVEYMIRTDVWVVKGENLAGWRYRQKIRKAQISGDEDIPKGYLGDVVAFLFDFDQNYGVQKKNIFEHLSPLPTCSFVLLYNRVGGGNAGE